MKRLVAGFMAVALSLVYAFAQVTAPQPTGTVQGAVLKTGTDEPIAGAQIRLIDADTMQSLLRMYSNSANGGRPVAGAPSEDLIRNLSDSSRLDNRATTGTDPNNQNFVRNLQRIVLTDDRGRFEFKNLEPGTYTLLARREGYFTASINNDSNATAMASVTVNGRAEVHVDLHMFQGSSISGSVFDKGKPQAGVTVQAYVVTYENGYQVLKAVASRSTDDRGEYRLFHLPPGEYLVAFVPRQVALRAGPPGDRPAASPVQTMRTFHPDATNPANARLLTLADGTEFLQAHIQVQTVQTYRVSGEILTSIPPAAIPVVPPVAEVGFALHDPDVPDDTGGTNIIGTIPLSLVGGQLRGRFEVIGVPPGDYDWRAWVNQTMPDGPAFVTTAVVPLSVRNGDVPALSIEINPLVRVTGAVTIDGKAPGKPPAHLSLQVEGSSAKRPGFISIASRIAEADPETGRFTIPGIQNGLYRIMMAANLPDDIYIAEVRQAGENVFDSGFLVGAAEPGQLQVVLRSGAGRITGTVRDAAGKPIVGATVALVPPAAWRMNRARYQTAISDASGRFSLSSIIPEDYKLFAWRDVPGGAYFNAKFIDRNEEQGIPVRVEAASNTTMNVIALSEPSR